MDGRRFDELTRALGAPENRRRFLKGLLGAGLAAVGLGRLPGSVADAQVTQVYCGNQFCASNPGGCKPGCVCCVYTNPVTGTVINSRCRPPGTCSPGTTVCPPGKFADPALGCVDCLSAANCPGPTDGNLCQVAACTRGVCGFQPGNAGATCRQTTCASGAVTSYACNSAGSCAATSPVACDPYTCADDGLACRTQCGDDQHCVAGAFCNGGSCTGDLELGSACTRASQCRSNFCTDGVCCEVESCGECHTCAIGPNPGTCFGASGPACSAGQCQQGNCLNGSCIERPLPDGTACGDGGECFVDVCFGGSCVTQSANEDAPCGDGGTDCNPTVCKSGLCRTEKKSGTSCADGAGTCLDGDCCIGATDSAGICPLGLSVCCETEPCCGPQACCDECFVGRGATGDTEYTCCPPASLCPPNDPDAPGCCFGDETCFQHSSGGYSCVRDALICGGATVCEEACCGSSCCAANQYCTPSLTCAPLPTGTCTDDDQCGAGLTCVGIEREFSENGPVIVTPGTCCPSNRVCTNPNSGGPFGPETSCAAYGMRCAQDGTSCTYAYLLSCPQPATSCLCSPRGGRTRV